MQSENQATPGDNDQKPVSSDSLPAVRILQSEELLAGEKESLILHGDEAYRLRCTRSGKLILQK